MENILEIKNLNKQYDGFSLSDISFSLPRGYICGLIGPNGSGKTTIIKLIMNIIPKDDGSIKVFGLDNEADEVEVKSRIGFVHDTPDFYKESKLKIIKEIVAPFYIEWSDEKFMGYIDKFELPLKKKFSSLSLGMKMKFWLAIALSHNAELILLDEPTSGLDPVFRREFLEMLSDIIQDERKSVLFSTHITSDLDRIADYITFIKNGKLVFSKTKDEIFDNYGVIKGGDEITNAKYENSICGYKKTSLGVDALTNNIQGIKTSLGDKAIYEKATLEDIMYYTDKKETKA